MRGMRFVETKMCISVYIGLLLNTLWPKYWFMYSISRLSYVRSIDCWVMSDC